MRTRSILRSVATAATLFTASQAYMIDASCGADGSDSYKIVKAMTESAFNLADAALLAVNNDDPFTQQLETWLFKDAATGKAVVKKTFEATTSDNPESCGILSFRDQKATREECTAKEVIIYCNQDRMTERADGWYNKLGKWVTSKWDCATALAITTAVDNQPDELQICPWFFEFAKDKYTVDAEIEELRKRVAVIETGQQLVSKLFGYTKIDSFALFDKVILHEFTHTKAGGRKDDVGGFLNAYGWLNCLKLGSTGQGVLNADSYGLFASAAYNAKDGIFVQEDGSLSASQGNTKRSTSIAEQAWTA